MTSTPFQKYVQNRVLIASRGDKIALLLKEAAHQMDKAQKACLDLKYEDRYNATERACTIMAGLRDFLDESVPGSENIVKILQNFYTLNILLCFRVNHKNDAAQAKKIANSLREMANTWLLMESQLSESSDNSTNKKIATGTGTTIGRFEV